MVPVGSFNWYQRLFCQKKSALGGSRTQTPALKTSSVTIAVFRDFKHYRATSLDKSKEALGTSLFSSPGAKVYFISRRWGPKAPGETETGA